MLLHTYLPIIKALWTTILSLTTIYVILYWTLPCLETRPKIRFLDEMDPTHKNVLYSSYHANMSMTFIGGIPRSGTTLMRSILDAHPDVRCGPETRIIPMILDMRSKMEQGTETSIKMFLEAKITDRALDDAIRAFILEIIVKHGGVAKHYCNKDPLVLKATSYLHSLYPNAKFLLMLRDGRAVVHSIFRSGADVPGYDFKSFNKSLARWNKDVVVMYGECLSVGPDHCMPVYYEQLVLHPEIWISRILHFLDLPWNRSVLHHEDYVDIKRGIQLTSEELTSEKVAYPINTDALDSWASSVPRRLRGHMDTIAPMLKTLGYDPFANPPDYKNPGLAVSENTLHVTQRQEFLEMYRKCPYRSRSPSYGFQYGQTVLEETKKTGKENEEEENVYHFEDGGHV